MMMRVMIVMVMVIGHDGYGHEDDDGDDGFGQEDEDGDEDHDNCSASKLICFKGLWSVNRLFLGKWYVFGLFFLLQSFF